jgi:hypothetical protein
METSPHHETNETNGEGINWDIKTEAEESAEYLAALGSSHGLVECPFRS